MQRTGSGRKTKIKMIGPLVSTPSARDNQNDDNKSRFSFPLRLLNNMILQIVINKNSKPSVLAWFISDMVIRENVKKNIDRNAASLPKIGEKNEKIKNKLKPIPRAEGNL